MRHFENKKTLEWYSITRLLIFDDTLLDFGKFHVSTFIHSINFCMWSMIEFGYSPPFKVINGNKIEIHYSLWTLQDRELTQLNSKCLNYFIYALK